MSTNVATQNKSNTAGMSKVRSITQVGNAGGNCSYFNGI